MQKLLIIILLAASQLLAGCSTDRRIPLVHRIDIQQGNVVTQDMLDKLEPGMERQKVRYVMGTPLIMDAFHQNRWDYVYSFRSGSSGKLEHRRISLYFKDDGLDRVAGDVDAPPTESMPAPSSGQRTVEVPAEDEGFLERLMKRFHMGKDAPEEQAPEPAPEEPAPQEDEEPGA